MQAGEETNGVKLHLQIVAAGPKSRLRGSNAATHRAFSWMLSHHQLAKLLLVSRAPGQISQDDPDAAALIEKNLVALLEPLLGESFLHVTEDGAALLRTLEGFAARQSSGQRHATQDFWL